MWSADGRYAASLEDCRPGSVWVWDAGAMELAALLMHLGPVTDLAWGPRVGGGVGGGVGGDGEGMMG